MSGVNSNRKVAGLVQRYFGDSYKKILDLHNNLPALISISGTLEDFIEQPIFLQAPSNVFVSADVLLNLPILVLNNFFNNPIVFSMEVVPRAGVDMSSWAIDQNGVITNQLEDEDIGHTVLNITGVVTAQDTGIETTLTITVNVYSVGVLIPDVSNPVITLNGDNPTTLVRHSQYVEQGATAVDDRDGDITGDIIISGSVDSSVLGINVIAYQVSDEANNVTQLFRQVNVVSSVTNTAPVITLTGDASLIINQGTPYVELGATALDNEDGDITADIVNMGVVDHNVVGQYYITYAVGDSNGVVTMVQRSIYVRVPNEQPVITLVGGDVSYAELSGNAYVDQGSSAVDVEDGIIPVIIGGDLVDRNVEGVYIITFDAVDSEGLSAPQLTRTVTVNANAQPVITVLGGNEIFLEGIGNETEVSILDVAYMNPAWLVGDLTINNTSGSYDGARGHIPQSTGKYAFEATLESGASWAFSVGLQQPQVGRFNYVGGEVGSWGFLGDGYKDINGAGLSSNGGALIGVGESITVLVDIDAGEMSVIYDGTTYPLCTGEPFGTVHPAIGASNSSTSMNFDIGTFVNVVPAGFEAWDLNSYTDLGATALDPEDGDITGDIVVGGDVVDVNVVGIYTIHYDVVDSLGHAAIRKFREVEVTAIPNTAPVITLVGDANISMPIGGEIPAGTYRVLPLRNAVSRGIFFLNEDDSYADVTVISEALSPWHPASQDFVFSTVLNHTYPSPNGYWSASTVVADAPIINIPNGATHFLVETSASGVVEFVLQREVSVGVFEDFLFSGMQNGNGTNIHGLFAVVLTDNAYLELGYTALDTEDGDITGDVIVGGDVVDLTTIGTYNITYDVTDSGLLPAPQKTRTVEILPPNVAPIITLAGDNPESVNARAMFTVDTWTDIEPDFATAMNDVEFEEDHYISLNGGTVGLMSYLNAHAVFAYGGATHLFLRDNGVLVGAEQDFRLGTVYEVWHDTEDTVYGDISFSSYLVEDPKMDRNYEYKMTVDYVSGADLRLVVFNPYVKNINDSASTNVTSGSFSDVMQGDGTTEVWIADTLGHLEVEFTTDLDDLFGVPQNVSEFEYQLSPVHTADYRIYRKKPTSTVWTVFHENLAAGGNSNTVVVDPPMGVYLEAGATAADAEDGDITADIVTAGDMVDLTEYGIYTRTYNVTDSGGANAVEVTRDITVIPREYNF